MLDNNYRCSKTCSTPARQGTPALRRSAATYGGSRPFREEPAFEAPLNVYGYQAAVRQRGAAHAAEGGTAGRSRFGPLLQRLRPARAATRGAWPRWPSTTSTSSASRQGQAVRRVAATPGHAVARLRLRRRRGGGQPGSCRTRTRAASSTSAAAAPSPSTMWPCHRQRGTHPTAWRRCRCRAGVARVWSSISLPRGAGRQSTSASRRPI